MRQVISASRRTDLPAHYYDWLVESFRAGQAKVSRPYSRGTVLVDLRPESVHTIVFWSKDFSRLLRDSKRWKEYHLYFQFTLNHCPELEAGVPPLAERLEQMRRIADEWGAERILWRFDPIVFWADGTRNNLGDFERIAQVAASCGIKRCTFSFMTQYPKVRSRGRLLGFDWFDPPFSKKVEVASYLARYLADCGIALYVCCNPELVGLEGIQPGRCIDGQLLADLAGEPADTGKDPTQRDSCGCTRSIEIGSYWMVCPHSCRYCYAQPANPASKMGKA